MSISGYFAVLTLTPAGNLLEALRKKNWYFDTPFTHILGHFLALSTKSILKFKKKGLNRGVPDQPKVSPEPFSVDN